MSSIKRMQKTFYEKETLGERTDDWCSTALFTVIKLGIKKLHVFRCFMPKGNLAKAVDCISERVSTMSVSGVVRCCVSYN